MAINFPSNPSLNDEFTSGDTSWRWDGTAWIVISNIQDSALPTFLNLIDTPSTYNAGSFLKVNTAGDRLIYTTIDANSFGNAVVQGEGTASATIPGDDLIFVAGTGMNITVDTQSNTLTFDSSASGTGDAFNLVVSDDGSLEAQGATRLDIIGGTNISTSLATDTTNLQINMDSFSIDFLTDVDVTSTPPTTGQVLKWNGNSWAPGVDATTGGAGTDADTLDGFDGSYYLDYNNFNNTPTVATLASFSIGNELSADGNGSITYDNTTGVFRYTPPDLSVYALSSAVFSGNYDDLSGKPTIPSSLTDLGISDGTDGQVLTTDGAGNFTFSDVSSGGGGGGIANIVEDTTPQLGGSLDTNSFGINNTQGNLVLQSGGTVVASTLNTTTLTLGTGQTYTLPTSDGSSGQVLSTNGSGQVTFSTLSTPSVAWGDLSNVPSSYTVDQVLEAAIVTLRVTSSGTAAYLFGHYGTTNNPTIYAISGTTIAFDLSQVPSHPFAIQDSTGTNFNTGLVHVDTDGTVSTGANAQGKTSGTLYSI